MNNIGIAVVTYNRLDHLRRIVAAVKKFTSVPYTLVIADDASSDGAREFAKSEAIVRLGLSNRGVAWNKNRGLYFLQSEFNAPTIILLEDDTLPCVYGWEQLWISAAQRHGYVTYAHPKVHRRILTGEGTVDDPYACSDITSQCAAVSAEALATVGFFDTRFAGYGHADSEWSTRMRRAGYGLSRVMRGSEVIEANSMIAGGVQTVESVTYRSAASVTRNAETWRSIQNDPIRRLPWRSAEDEAWLKREVESALLEQRQLEFPAAEALPAAGQTPSLSREVVRPGPTRSPKSLSVPGMRHSTLGIGIISYNRIDHVRRTIEAVRKFTTSPFFLVVADDGSTDGTRELLKSLKVTTVGAENMGVAWNKNRALCALRVGAGVDRMVLLEDDTAPVARGWELLWMKAADRYGFVSYAHPSVRDAILSGSGGPDDPYAATRVALKCVAITKIALDRVGYIDPRWDGDHDQDHEWVKRLRQQGFGTVVTRQNGVRLKANCAIDGDVVSAADRNFQSVKQGRKLGEPPGDDSSTENARSGQEERDVLLCEVATAIAEISLTEHSAGQWARTWAWKIRNNGTVQRHRKLLGRIRSGISRRLNRMFSRDL
ncbi:MAG: glycosyl transferase, family 2 [Devosia sp.]|nr:glycosyl transferase, family 2 [Devosia sp.]